MYILDIQAVGWKCWSNFVTHVTDRLPPSDNHAGVLKKVLKDDYNCTPVGFTLQFNSEEDATAFKLKWS